MRAAEEEGEVLTVVGRMLQPGEPAPDFTLDRTAGAVSLRDLAGSTVVVNVVNSVDTPVCDIQPAGSTTCSRGPTC